MDNYCPDNLDNFLIDNTTPSKKKMIKQIINQAIPCSLCSMLMMSQALVNTIFAGHISNRNSSYLSAFGMGSSFQNMFGLSIIMGINYAFEIASS